MSILDSGSQLITFDFKNPATGESFNRMMRFKIKPGVYSGFNVTNPAGNTLRISPGQAWIDCLFDGTDSRAIAVETQVQFDQTAVQSVATFDDYLVLTYEYIEATINFADFTLRSTSVAAGTNEVILARIAYDGGGNVTGVTFTGRTHGLLEGSAGNAYNYKMDRFLEMYDVVAPANPTVDGSGRLYKKTGANGLFWRPDAAGTEVDLTGGGSATGDVTRMLLGFDNSFFKFAFQTFFVNDATAFVNVGATTALDGQDKFIFTNLLDKLITQDIVSDNYTHQSAQPINRVNFLGQYNANKEDESPGLRISRNGGLSYTEVPVRQPNMELAVAATTTAIYAASNQNSERALDNGTARPYLAQRFLTTNRHWCSHVFLYLKRKATPGGRVKVQIRGNGGANLPSGTIILTESKFLEAASAIDLAFSFIRFDFPQPIVLENATNYHIVLTIEDVDNYDYVNASSELVWGIDTLGGYLAGSSKSINGTTFSADGDDFIFNVSGNQIQNEPGSDLVTGEAVMERVRPAELIVYDETNANAEAIIDNGTIVSGFGQFGQRFRFGTDYILDDIQVYLKRTGAPGGLIQFSIYDNVSATPGNQIYQSHNKIKSDSIATAPEYRTFDFQDPVYLSANTDYWFVVEGVTGDVGNYAYTVANYIGVQLDSSSNYSQGGIIGWNATPAPWGTENLTQAAIFKVRGVPTDEQILTLYDSTNSDDEQTDLTGVTGPTQRVAQSIQVPQDSVVRGARLYLSRLGTPGGNCFVELYTSVANEPAVLLSTGISRDVNSLTSLTTPSMLEFEFPEQFKLVKATIYWLVLRTDTTYAYSAGVNELRWHRDATFSNYLTSLGSSDFNGVSWAGATTKDFMFEILGHEAELILEITGRKTLAELAGFGLWYTFATDTDISEKNVSTIILDATMLSTGEIPYGGMVIAPGTGEIMAVDNTQHIWLPERGDFLELESTTRFKPSDLVGLTTMTFVKIRHTISFTAPELTLKDRLRSLPEPVLIKEDAETIRLDSNGGGSNWKTELPNGLIVTGQGGAKNSFAASKRLLGGLGLDIGSESGTQDYFIYIVQIPGSSRSAGIIWSVIAPTAGGPLGFQYWKCIGVFQNDGSSNINGLMLGGNSNPISSEWVPFTPTGSWTTNSTYTGFWRRNGDTLEAQSRVTLVGAPNIANLTVNLPAGLVIDTAKGNFDSGGVVVGQNAAFDGGLTLHTGVTLYESTTAIRPQSINTAGATGVAADITQLVPFTWANTDYITLDYKVPILGWKATEF